MKSLGKTEREPKTEGQRLLCVLDDSEAKLAATLGCKPAIVGHWRRGIRLPGEAARHKMELLVGIPRRSWDVEPGVDVEPFTPSASPSPSPSPSREDDDTLDITKAQIDAVLDDLKAEGLTDSASAKLRDTLSKLLALRARLERDRDLLEDRVVREHPEWLRVKTAILRALKPYPDAAAAVAEALEPTQ